MATDTLTIYIGDDSGIAGKDFVGDENNNQIVTILPDPDDEFDESSFTWEFWGKDSPTEPGAGPGGDDIFHMDLSLFNEDFSFTVKSMDAGDIFDITGWDSVEVVGTVYTFTYTGTDGLEHTFVIDAQSTNGEDGVDVVQVLHKGNPVTLVCFTRGTLIKTVNGSEPIESLREGDLVLCGDGNLRPICWIGSRQLEKADLERKPEWRPVQFKAGALGEGMPSRDLSLSPQHAVLIRDWRAELMFGEHEVLVPAKHLINDLSIRQDTECEEVEYFHIMLDEHHTVMAEGLECETLFVSALQSGALSPEARDEICGIFPELVADLENYGESYRLILRRFEAEALGSEVGYN